LRVRENVSADNLPEARRWFVAHTRARCEKQYLAACQRSRLEAVLPCYPSMRRYRRKTVVFTKPLFPGYVFLRITADQSRPARQHKSVVRLLEVDDQPQFERQLESILRALETGLEIRLAPAVAEGARVKIKSGPLRGLEGWVEQRHGLQTVQLRLDFIGQAAAVKMSGEELELI